jgi:hypothetical protein
MTARTPLPARIPALGTVRCRPFQPRGWCSRVPAQMWRGRAESRLQMWQERAESRCRCDGVDAHNRAEQDGERPTRLERDCHPLCTRAEQYDDTTSVRDRLRPTARVRCAVPCLVSDPRAPECDDIPLLQREVGALEACSATSSAETNEPWMRCRPATGARCRSDHDEADSAPGAKANIDAVDERRVWKRSAAAGLSRADAERLWLQRCPEDCALRRMRGSRARLGRSP